MKERHLKSQGTCIGYLKGALAFIRYLEDALRYLTIQGALRYLGGLRYLKAYSRYLKKTKAPLRYPIQVPWLLRYLECTLF